MNRLDPACATEKREAAFEIKFVLPAECAGAVLTWARANLTADPHADGVTGDGYRVNSLYFDTKKLDVYRRNGSYGRSKYRIRRYGTEDSIFLERKLKSRGLVSKRRTRIPDEEIWRVGVSEVGLNWVGHWFRRRLEARGLQPRCQIRYERVARLGLTPDGPIRLTVDREVRGFLTDQYGVFENGVWIPLLPDRCILELKFRREMPSLFKGLVEEFSLKPMPVSKYRLSIQALGLAPEVPDVPPVNGNGHAAANALIATDHPVTLAAPIATREA